MLELYVELYLGHGFTVRKLSHFLWVSEFAERKNSFLSFIAERLGGGGGEGG
jgi:hypothetical protein